MKFYNFVALLICISYLIISISCNSVRSKKSLKSKRVNAKDGLTMIRKNTKDEESGKGSIFYLDRHNLNCETGAMSEFTLMRKGPYKYHFNYACILPTKCDQNCVKMLKEHDAKNCQHKTTTPNDINSDENKSLNFLDRHKIECPADHLLTQFNMKSKRNPNKIFFNYTCCPAKVSDCKEGKMKEKAFGDFSTLQLGQYKVGHESPDQYALRGFQLKVDYASKKYHYEYSYCKVIG